MCFSLDDLYPTIAAVLMIAFAWVVGDEDTDLDE